MSESKSTFLKQSAWMVAATLAGGVGMTLVHVVVGRKPEVYAQFKSLLAIFYVVGAAQGGLWNLFAQQTAAALTPEDRTRVVAAVFRTARWILGLMALAGLGLLMEGSGWAVVLKLPSTAALWATWGLILATLLAALLRGLLQGGQNFTGLGLLSVFDGFGRFVAVAVIVLLLDGGAAGAVTGALLGNLAAIAVGIWALRGLFRGAGASPVAGAVPPGFWPLCFAAAALQALGQLDNVFLQSVVPGGWVKDLGRQYSTGAQIGFALTQFTVPLALVMFPKVVKGAASGNKTDALRLTLLSTLALGGLAALGCTLFPWLPVKILFPSIPTELSAPLVPWFAWGMLCYTVANVFLSDRIAHGDFRFVPWVVVLALAYAAVLWSVKGRLLAGSPSDAFLMVVRLLCSANASLLLLAFFFSRRARGGAIGPAQTEALPTEGR
jgi:O-antigen/teichoic acid export membrane protein